MSTVFQWVIDNAESISINKRGIVSQTVSRDQTIRATTRGGQIWRFDVKLPNGLPWDTWRPYIAQIENLDRHTNHTIQVNNAGYTDWLNAYQGDAANPAAITATWTNGNNNLTLTGGEATSGYNFKAGDWIQLGSSGSVYEVVSDVAWNSTVVTVNRPIIDATSTGTLRVGPACTFDVICSQFPTWSIFSRNQVAWSGSFIFLENLA